jgi:hypothetical protein
MANAVQNVIFIKKFPKHDKNLKQETLFLIYDNYSPKVFTMI